MIENGSKTIIIPIGPISYDDFNSTRKKFRKYLDQTIEEYPELFPSEIIQGYDFKGWTKETKKLPLKRRIIELRNTRVQFLIHPCFVLPYLSGLTQELSKGLRLRKDNVSYDTIAATCGKDAMFWYRLEMSLARNSIVGTTVKCISKFPKHILVDEHHNRLNRKKIYVCTTVGQDCFFGAELTDSVSAVQLKRAYQVFKKEYLFAFPDHKILTINTDGFPSTVKAIKELYPESILLTCFLHACLKIQTNMKRTDEQYAYFILNKAWECYQAKDKTSFAQRIRRLEQIAKQKLREGNLQNSILKLCNKKDNFIKAYDYQQCHRTSNMLDRLMKFQNRRLDNSQHFHGKLESANNAMRAHALLVNFCPYNSNTIRLNGGVISPFEKLNGFRYRDNWLENLLVASSMNGNRYQY